MENVLSIAGSGQGLSYWSLIAHASLLVQLVMLLLLLASLFSWTVIFARRAVLKAAVREADDFEDAFWSGGDTTELYNRWTARGKNQSGMATLFVSGYREYSRLAGKGGVDRNNVLDGVGRAMRVALSREIDALENHLSFLATVGSTSPYVGLFGTVWGIMNSFRSLGTMQQATIASVAPGIAEALVATAMGLFAAIPAVIAYNRFSNRVERLVARYETFIEEFLSIVGRQSFVAPAVQPTSARQEIHAA